MAAENPDLVSCRPPMGNCLSNPTRSMRRHAARTGGGTEHCAVGEGWYEATRREILAVRSS